jgi:hypothetical protein
MPSPSERLNHAFLAKGVHTTTAIEGNTLTGTQARERIEGQSNLPPSREYLGREVDNIVRAINGVEGAPIADGPREEAQFIRDRQWDLSWRDFVYESLEGSKGPGAERQRRLVLDLGRAEAGQGPVPLSQIRDLSPRVAALCAGKTTKTLVRDLNRVVLTGLVERCPKGRIWIERRSACAKLSSFQGGLTRSMPKIAVRIPQMGEGLQEARLVGYLKQPGDAVKRDEPIYQMETDKAVMDVESPYEGRLVAWLAEVDSVLPIGSPVAEMEVAEGVQEMAVHGAPGAEGTRAESGGSATQVGTAVSSGAARNASVPPRTRAYAREKGISDDELARIPSASGKLLPSDIDAFLSSGPAPVSTASRPGAGGTYKESPLTQKQRLLSSRLVRSAQLVVPGTISMEADWGAIEEMRAAYRDKGGDFQPSSFTMFAYAVAKAMSSTKVSDPA